MKRIVFLLLVVVVLAGCKSSKHLATSEKNVQVSSYLTSKLQLTIPGKKGGSMSVGGTMKMKTHERVQISLLMPILRTEVARVEVTPDGVLLVDRMNKRFVRATKDELKGMLPKNAEFSRLEKILLDASLPGGKTELSGKDIGIPSLEKAKVQLYEFSTKEFSMTPTELTSKYRQVPLEELVSKRGALQKQISETESILKDTKKDVGSQLNSLAVLTGQIEERKRYIIAINNDVEAIERELTSLQRQLNGLQKDLKDKKKKYEASVQYLYKNKSIEEKLMFIFSAKNLGQTYRRMRYVREYATYQRLQGEEILKKQEQIRKKKVEREQVKAAKESLLKEREGEKTKLEAQEKEKRTLVANLQKKQRGLQGEINKKRREANQLNARIDKLIAEEIERARKRAEEEARREAAARKKAEGKESQTAGTGTTVKTNSKPLETYTMSKADRELSGNFAANRGKLPMPISGAYIITSHYGQYAVEGLRNVKLDNKGIDIQGKPGAQARAIFDGKVAAVFQLNGLFNVLIRHGNYISVYCNLSSASVKSGDMVKTKQSIGQVFSDGTDNGRTVLHFQLRREKEKLNPEPWLNR